MELEEAARAAFARYDHDGSGRVDACELRRLAADLGGLLTTRDAREALRVLDRNGDGAIDQDEFVAWWVGQAVDRGADAVVAGALAQLREAGSRRFRVDVHSAAWAGEEAVMIRLLDHDAGLVHAKDESDYGDGNTPLHYAAYQGHASLCALLISRSAKVNAANRSGCTPLFYAAQQSQAEVVALLLQDGGDPRVVENQHGWSAVDVTTDPAVLALFQSIAGDPPLAPGKPTAEAVSPSEIRLQWTAPPPRLENKLPVSGYHIKVLASSAPARLLAIDAAAAEATVDSLLPGTEYTFEVAAVNLSGAGDFSSASDPVTTGAAEMKAPTLRVARLTPDTAVLQWKSNPRAVKWVVLQLTAASGHSWMPVIQCDADTSSATVSGLLPETTYHFRVKVVDAEGRHVVSEPVSALTSRRVSSFFRAAMAAKNMSAASHPDESDGKEEEDKEEKQEEEEDTDSNMAANAKEEEEGDMMAETKSERVRSRRAAAKHVDGDESVEDDDDFIYYDSSSSDE